MGKKTQGRRIPIINHGANPAPMVGEMPPLTQPGDYCGPLLGYTGDKPAVFFLLPNARDENTHGHGRSVHHVVGPPHIFTEEADGSLTIRDSIGAMPHWHGYLTAGVWEEC